MPAKNAPMAAAPLVFSDDGRVAWNLMWDEFCYLAVEGGPPHRGTMLRGKGDANDTSSTLYTDAVAEILRAFGLLIPFKAESIRPGWIAVHLWSGQMAAWYERIILAENVECRRDGKIILLPVNDDFTLKNETKNVVTVVAKAYHYWALHRNLWEKLWIILVGLDLKG